MGYRNRVQLHVRGSSWAIGRRIRTGFAPIEQCPISSPSINEVIATLREMLRDARWPRFIQSIEVFTDEREVQFNVLDTERPVARRFFEWCGTLMPGLVEGALDYRGRVTG